MPVESKKNDTTIKTTVTAFKKTPPISTYLVAFVVSDYGFKENGTHRVYTKPDAVSQTNYALDFGAKVIEELNKYTDIKYESQMPKMDQVSIRDFNPGAMENWGLVTYRYASSRVDLCRTPSRF